MVPKPLASWLRVEGRGWESWKLKSGSYLGVGLKVNPSTVSRLLCTVPSSAMEGRAAERGCMRPPWKHSAQMQVPHLQQVTSA